HVIEGGRRIRYQVGVAQQRQVLDRVRQQVLLAVVGGGVVGDIEEVALLLAQLDGGDDTVGDELAQPVVRAHGDVGALAGRNLLDEVVLDLRVVLRHEVDGDAGLLLVGGGDVLECIDALGVYPDGQFGGAFSVLGLASAASATGQGQDCGGCECASHEDAAGAESGGFHHHRCHLSCGGIVCGLCKRLHSYRQEGCLPTLFCNNYRNYKGVIAYSLRFGGVGFWP